MIRFSSDGKHDANYESYLKQLDVPNFLVDLILDSTESITITTMGSYINVKTTLGKKIQTKCSSVWEKCELFEKTK